MHTTDIKNVNIFPEQQSGHYSTQKEKLITLEAVTDVINSDSGGLKRGGGGGGSPLAPPIGSDFFRKNPPFPV